MKREILFRGKSINGDWHFGHLAVLKKNTNGVRAGTYISNSTGFPFAYEVDPKTVGQFTGLLDKNGKKIFEGDKLSTISTEEYFEYEVKFEDAQFVMYSKHGRWGPLKRMPEVCHELKIPLCEITGTIHDKEKVK